MSIQALTQENIAAFKRLGRQDHKDALIVAKFFLPSHGFYWYFTELDVDPDSDYYGIGFGFANLNDPDMSELGEIDLIELLNLNRKPQINRETCRDLRTVKIGGREAYWRVVERDIHFPVAKIKISDVMEKVRAGKHV